MSTPIQNYVYRQYIHCAGRRNISFELNIETFLQIAAGACVYCLATNSNTANRKQYAVKTWTYNGVDRVNSDLAYTTGNCVSCCKQCNAAKAAQDLYTFLGSDWLAERIKEISA